MTMSLPRGMKATFSLRPKSVSAMNHNVGGLLSCSSRVSSKYNVVRFAKHSSISVADTGGVLAANFASTPVEILIAKGYTSISKIWAESIYTTFMYKIDKYQ